jgi:predicted nucleotidyltransferase
MNPISPTHHPDVNEILDLLLRDSKAILKDQLIGMYLFGSLANGGFDKDSDIDILIVTKDEISEEAFSALYAMHEKISALDSPWAIQLEVSYIPKAALRRYDPMNNKHPHHDRGNGERLHVMQHDSDWIIQRFILRERGITIIGPTPKSLIDPVSSDDLKWAVVDILNSWIKGFLDDSSILESRGYQSYTVLTLCRILHTYEYCVIVSKPVAAEWAKQTLDKKWIPLIERAWSGRQNPGIKSDLEDLNGTLDIIRYSLEKTK